MYRRQRGSSAATLLNVIVLGVIAGVIFLFIDRTRQPEVTPVETPSLDVGQVALALTPAATATPMPAAPTPTAAPKATLFIPTAGVSAPVVDVYLDGESWDVSQLAGNAGHLQGTAWFDELGNIVLAGHVEQPDGRAGIFARIENLNAGDPLVLTLGGSERRYAVTEVKRVQPDDLSVLYPTQTDIITLITCDSYDFLQDSYQERVVVVAERVA